MTRWLAIVTAAHFFFYPLEFTKYNEKKNSVVEFCVSVAVVNLMYAIVVVPFSEC